MKGFDLDSLGLGSTNIIYIALKLLEYSFIRELDEIQAKYLLLLFEEPEAHLHKHIQMSLFDKTGLNADEGVQVIMKMCIRDSSLPRSLKKNGGSYMWISVWESAG